MSTPGYHTHTTSTVYRWFLVRQTWTARHRVQYQVKRHQGDIYTLRR